MVTGEAGWGDAECVAATTGADVGPRFAGPNQRANSVEDRIKPTGRVDTEGFHDLPVEVVAFSLLMKALDLASIIGNARRPVCACNRTGSDVMELGCRRMLRRRLGDD